MTINDQANTTIERTIAPIPGLPILISGLAVVLLSSYWTVWIVRQFLERTGEGSWGDVQPLGPHHVACDLRALRVLYVATERSPDPDPLRLV